VIENDGIVRGGIGATVAGKKLTLGGVILPTQLGDVQALPEFADLKLLAPNFPTLPPNLAVFSAPGGLCGRIATTINANNPGSQAGVVANTVGNRARIGLLGKLGCPQADMFTT
jgi:hypothetical protein